MLPEMNRDVLLKTLVVTSVSMCCLVSAHAGIFSALANTHFAQLMPCG